MEEAEIKNISKVWERVYSDDGVTEAPQDQGQSLTAMLREFIDDEAMDAATYTLLAVKTKGTPGEKLLKNLAEDERRHERSLQSEYFLLTGDTWTPRKRYPSAPYLLSALRERFIAEQRGADKYEETAKTVTDEQLRTVLFELARDERRHARELRRLVERMIY